MARSKEFEPTEALDKAMRLFWQQGYLATSIDDLVTATGVQRYGLYGTFGDKHSLFLQALDYYQETAVTKMVQGLESPEASWPAIEAFFENFLTLAGTPGGQFGCLMCNAATELAAQDPSVAEKMALYEARLTRLFAQALTRAQAHNELGSRLDPDKGAAYLLGIALGFFTLAKTPVPTTTLEDYLSTALDGLKSLAAG